MSANYGRDPITKTLFVARVWFPTVHWDEFQRDFSKTTDTVHQFDLFEYRLAHNFLGDSNQDGGKSEFEYCLFLTSNNGQRHCFPKVQNPIC